MTIIKIYNSIVPLLILNKIIIIIILQHNKIIYLSKIIAFIFRLDDDDLIEDE